MNIYSSGLVTGVIFGVLFIVIMCIVRKMRGKNAAEVFDERQLLVRFKAYQISFFVLICGIFIDACMKIYGWIFYEDPLGEITAIIVAIAVFAVMNIRQGAFLALNRKRKPLLLLYGVICFSQLAGTVGYLMNGELIKNGKLTMRCVSPVVLILFLLVFVLLIRQPDNQEEQGEE